MIMWLMQGGRNVPLTMDKLVALCKVRGFIFPGSEIYGGLANTWDYGPLGVEFKNNVKRAWWKKFVQESEHNVGLDSAILMNRSVWVASGHVGNFNDPLMDCKGCKARFRADQLIEEDAKSRGEALQADGWSNERLEAWVQEKQIACYELQIAEVEGQLASPPLEWSAARVAEVAQTHATLSSQLEAAISAWENLHLENEQAAAELARLKEGVSYGAE